MDEIGLTSDKYIPLNETLSSLPLKITIEPMSIQRWQLMQVCHVADSRFASDLPAESLSPAHPDGL